MEVRPLSGMDLSWDREAIMISRPNRFLAVVNVMDEDAVYLEGEKVHVHDPGRLKEILFPGNRLRIRKALSSGRKTSWDLIAGKVEGNWVLVNSSFHRRISETILTDPLICPFRDIEKIRPEVKVGSSRLDFLLEHTDGSRTFVEVKGCTLSENGKALFPDAPTSRGVRHLRELMEIKRKGDKAAVVILVMAPDAECFSPNRRTDPDFSDTFFEAMGSGVEIHPLRISLDGENLNFRGVVPVCNDGQRR